MPIPGVGHDPQDSELFADTPAIVSCYLCGHVLGAHEPMVMFHQGMARETSRAIEFRLPLAGKYYHRDCYRTL